MIQDSKFKEDYYFDSCIRVLSLFLIHVCFMNMTFQLQDSVFGRSLPPSREKDHLRGCRSGKKEEIVTKHLARRALLWVWVHCTEIVLLWVPLVLRLTRARAEHQAPKRFCSRRRLTVGSGRKESLVAPITGLKSRSHEQLCFENWNQINAAWLRELGQICRLASVCFLIKKTLSRLSYLFTTFRKWIESVLGHSFLACNLWPCSLIETSSDTEFSGIHELVTDSYF